MEVTLCSISPRKKYTGVGGSLEKVKTGLEKEGVTVHEYYPQIKLSTAFSDFYYGLRLKQKGIVHSYTELSWNTKNAFRTYCVVWKTNEKIYNQERNYAERSHLWFKPYFIIHNKLEEKCVNNNIAICESDIVKRNLHEEYGIENKNIHKIPIGIDSDAFKPEKGNRKKYGLSNEDFLVSWVGHPEYNKGMKYLFETAHHIEDEKIKFILRSREIQPNHPLYSEYLKVKDKIIYLPQPKHMSEFYNLSDIYYMSSSYETFCISLAEAMSCGKPGLGFEKVGIAEEVLKNNDTGFLGKYEDSQYIADKIVYLKENSEKRKKMGLNARKIIQEKYRIEVVGKKHVKTYENYST